MARLERGSAARWAIGGALVACLALALQLARRVADVERAPEASAVERPRAEAEMVATPAVVEEPAGEAPARDAPADVGRAAAEVEELDERIVFELHVRVADAHDGKPVAGAAVTLADRATPLVRRTDDEGRCALALARPNVRARLRVEAAGYRDWSDEVEGSSAAVELLPTVRLVGRVLAADTGRPVANAELALVPVDDGRFEPSRARAEGDGSFVLAGAPLRVATILEVRADGFAPSRRALELRSASQGGATRELRQDVRLARGVELAGRVEDWVTGAGLAGARFDMLVAREDGEFGGLVLPHPGLGWMLADAKAEGYASMRIALAPAQHAEPLVLRLPRLATIEGTLRDAAGEPRAGENVRFLAAGPLRGEDGEVLDTSPLYDLPEDRFYWSGEAAQAPGTTQFHHWVDATTGADGGYSLRVLPWALGGELEGRRVPPIEPGATWRADVQRRASLEPSKVTGVVTLNGQGASALSGTVRWRGPTRSGAARQERDGRRRGFEALVEPGDLRFVAELDQVPGVESAEIAVRVGENESRALVLDVVVPARPEDALSGTVRFADGSPVTDVEVAASCALPGDERPVLVYRARTGTDGGFELRVVDIGLAYSLSITHPPFDSVYRTDVPAGSSEIEIVLSTARRLLVRAHDAASGQALYVGNDLRLLARDEGRPAFRSLEPVAELPDADGWHEFLVFGEELDVLALPDAYLLPDYARALVRDVRLGTEPKRLHLALERGLEIEVALAEDAEPWPDDRGLELVEDTLAASVHPYDWAREPFDNLARQGTIEFGQGRRSTLRGLAPGVYRVRTDDDLVVEPELVEIGPGRRSVELGWHWAD